MDGTATMRTRTRISIPSYSLGEELFNSISHGIGAALSIAALVVMVVKADGPLATACVAVYGSSMIVLYTMSCIYHALSPSLGGKRVLRVLDHCNVYLLVFGTYIPAALLGVGGALGWVLFGVVAFFTVLGIVFTAIDVDRFGKIEVVCHLISGWSIVVGIPQLLATMGLEGVLIIVAGGVMYTIGSVIYGIGKRRKYMHSVFHIFCLAGTFLQFWGIYWYLL